MSDDLPLTAAEKRAAQARARADVNAHPLFPAEFGEKPVAVAWVQIRRYTENGPIDHQRVWPAGELQGQDDIYQFFGGGAYELWGRAALPNGTPGAIVKKVRLTLDGPPKPFAGQAQAGALAAASAAGGVPPSAQSHDRLDFMLQMMAEDRREARMREERRERESREERERQLARDEQRSREQSTLMVQGLQVAAGIVSAILARPPPPAPPPGPDLMPLVAALIPKPDNADPLDRLSKVLDIAKKVNPEKSTESLPELMNGFGQAMSGLAQVEASRIEAAKHGLLGAPVSLPGSSPAPATAATANGNAHPTERAPASVEPLDDPATLSS
jgi:hypothetical protein